MRRLSTRQEFRTPLFSLLVEGRPLDRLPILTADIFLAVDRPDRLEVSWLRPSDAPCGEDGMPRPGTRVQAFLGSRSLFEGRVERAESRLDPRRGSSYSLVAYADYHEARFRAREETVTLHQVTDSELARTVASSLDLVAVTEPTGRVHEFLHLRGDPLVQLRTHARACALELAVTGGRLHFQSRVPESGWIVIEDPRHLLELRVTDRGKAAGGRGGTLEVPGDPRWSPLRGLILSGPEPIVRGYYRVVRALHRLDGTGYRTQLEFLEGPLDYEAWSRVREPAERGNGNVRHDR